MVAPRALVFRPLVNGNEDSGNEIGVERASKQRERPCREKPGGTLAGLRRSFSRITLYTVL